MEPRVTPTATRPAAEEEAEGQRQEEWVNSEVGGEGGREGGRELSLREQEVERARQPGGYKGGVPEDQRVDERGRPCLAAVHTAAVHAATFALIALALREHPHLPHAHNSTRTVPPVNRSVPSKRTRAILFATQSKDRPRI